MRIWRGHKIRGKCPSYGYFSVTGPFGQYPIKITLPRLEKQHVERLEDTLHYADVPKLEERKRIVESLADYVPSEESLEVICRMTGMPIRLVAMKIDDGKKIAGSLLDIYNNERGKKTAIAISPNDPREWFYFLGHAVLAGSPTSIKVSSREPVLGHEIVEYMEKQGLPENMVSLYFADTSSPEESKLTAEILRSAELAIVMGDAVISDSQLSFYAERSRGLVLDAEAAVPFIKDSVMWPSSCLAEHNYMVVGQKNLEIVMNAAISAYNNLVPGHLLNPETTLGIIEKPILEHVAAMLSTGQMMDNARIIHPSGIGMKVEPEDILKGVVVEHFPENPSVGMNPLMVNPLPAYITCIRHAKTIEDALRDLEAAKKHIGDRSMALGVYGNVPEEMKGRVNELAYDVHYGSSPMMVDGICHQGVCLHKELTNSE